MREHYKSAEGPPVAVAVGSLNRIKISAVEQGFRTLLERAVVSYPVDVPSAPAQPMSDQATLAGARHRAACARAACPHASYWVGIEGGVDSVAGMLMAVGWVVVEGVERTGVSRSASFELPEPVALRVRQGTEMGQLTAQVHTDDMRTTGLVGALTIDRVTRESLYVQPVMLALMRLMPTWSDVSSRA